MNNIPLPCERIKMKKTLSIMLIILMFTPVSVMSAEQFSFMGVNMGSSFDEQFKPCSARYVSDEGKCYKVGIYSKKPEPKSNIYQIENLPWIGVTMSTTAFLLDGNVEALYITTDDKGAEHLLELMKEKYGDPTTFTQRTVTNNAGAKFPSFTARWMIKDCTMTLIRRYQKINDGNLFIMTEKYEREQKDKINKSKKDALDKL
jgi:hypothetical protein